jgi:hypothetical protein
VILVGDEEIFSPAQDDLKVAIAKVSMYPGARAERDWDDWPDDSEFKVQALKVAERILEHFDVTPKEKP